MAFIDEILQTPSYGWMDAKGLFLKPTTRQLFKEAFSRINIFKTRKNWIALISWFMASLYVSFICHFSNLFSILEISYCPGCICHGYHEYPWNHLVSSLSALINPIGSVIRYSAFDNTESGHQNFS